MNRQYDTLQNHTAEPTQQARWFNESPERLERARAKGYRPVLKNGQEVRQVVGPGITALLMEIPKVKRNLDGFFKVRKGMGANVKARILRLNPTIEEGAIIRGWHPTRTGKALYFMRGLRGKGWVIKNYGREAWEEVLEHGYLIKLGKREYVGYPDVVELSRCVAEKGSKHLEDYMRRSK